MTDKRAATPRRRARADRAPGSPPGHPDQLPFPHLTGYWVNRLAGAFRTAVDRELREHDLTRRQVGTLMHVHRGLARSASDLTRMLRVDSTAVTRMVDRLEERGLLVREPDPEDGRRQLLHLTDEAEALMPLVMDVARRVEARFEDAVAARDLEAFHRVLMRMLENVGEDHFALVPDGGEGA